MMTHTRPSASWPDDITSARASRLLHYPAPDRRQADRSLVHPLRPGTHTFPGHAAVENSPALYRCM